MPLFPTASDILARGSGSLAEVPFPVLLQALFEESRTVTLSLRLHNLEKKITLEDGAPVACRTNLLHETLGRFLVSEGAITDAQYQAALAASQDTGLRMGELLVEKQIVAPFDLYKLMQKNLAHKLLDCFQWDEGTWKLDLNADEAATPLHLNPAQLVWAGCLKTLPLEHATAFVESLGATTLAISALPPHPASGLKLGAKDARLLKVFDVPQAWPALVAAGLYEQPADLARRVYALCVLEYVVPSDEADALKLKAAEAEAQKVAAARPTAQVDRDAIAQLFMDHRTLDAFDILGVPVTAKPALVRRAFLERAEQMNPWSFGDDEKEVARQAEAVLLALAKSYGELMDVERRRQIEKRREAAAQKAPKKIDFSVDTNMLDARAQFDEAYKLMAGGKPGRAAQYLQYAVDIEPGNHMYVAWMWWCRYLYDPEKYRLEALGPIEAAAHARPQDANMFYFLGELKKAVGDSVAASAMLKRALSLDPGHAYAKKALAGMAG